jgi:hypothetical protein
MTTNDSGDFDPRFDPAFQRGFDGTPTRGRGREQSADDPRGSSRSLSDDSRGSSRSLADDSRGSSTSLSDDPRGSSRSLSDRVETSPPQAPAAPSAPVARSVPATTDADTTDASITGDAAEPTGRTNPFVIALIVVSVALIAGGVWGVQAAREPFLRTDAAVDVDYSGLQMLMTFSPIAIALGIATAVGILFLYAARWQHRR